MLDSLSLSVHPRISFVDGEVSVSDLMNNSVGALVRMRTPGSIQPLNVPYVGQAAEGVLRYFDSVREERTGITKAAAGLDPDHPIAGKNRLNCKNTRRDGHKGLVQDSAQTSSHTPRPAYGTASSEQLGPNATTILGHLDGRAGQRGTGRRR